jgi:hypothetical protein
MDIIDIRVPVRSAVDDALARAVAIGGLVVIALIHILQTPTAFSEAGYLGGLFIAAAVAAILLAGVLTRTGDPRAWAAAGALAGLILLGYVISRSIGLPGFTSDIGEWAETPGLASMVVEGLVVTVSAMVLASPEGVAAGRSEPSAAAGASAPQRRAAFVMRSVRPGR